MTNYFTPPTPDAPQWVLDQALELINEVRSEHGMILRTKPYGHEAFRALCIAIEQKAALQAEFDQFKQDVSDAAVEYNDHGSPMAWTGFDRFINTKPDPLLPQARKLAAQHFEALAVDSIGSDYYKITAANLRKGAADDTPVVQVVLRTLRWVKENPL